MAKLYDMLKNNPEWLDAMMSETARWSLVTTSPPKPSLFIDGHTYGRDCWCNPYVVNRGDSIWIERSGVIPKIDVMEDGVAVVHFDPKIVE